MNRFSLLAVCFTGGVAALIIAARRAESGAADALVRLQPVTPGIQQIGNAHLSGTIKAGQFVGGGLGLTNVNADLLDGINSTSFLQSVPVPLTLSGSSTTHIIRGENASNGTLSVGVFGASTAASAQTYGVWGESSSSLGRGVFGYATSSSGNTYGVSGRSSSVDGSGVFGYANANSGTNYGGQFLTESSSGRGVFGYANAGSGTTYGGRFESDSTTGRGVFGYASAATGIAYGGRFESASSDGRGVYGLASSSTGTNYGGKFESLSDDGRGVFGFVGSGSGFTYGVYGESSSQVGTGVYGYATATDAFNYGVYGRTPGNQGRGVFGQATSATGITYGVIGYATSAGYGVYANGDIGASGIKSFRIDYPNDPENKYLLHYSTESPFPQNSYSGNIVTDAKGYAWVQLPDYFDEINTDCKYQLTVLDDLDSADFVQVKVSKEIVANRFQIRTSAPNIKVSWRVEANRNDAYVRARRPKDVIGKMGTERGTYQHPDLYGKPENRGLTYVPEPAQQPKSDG